MPDYTVSGDVDSMLRSANDAAIRSAIGVGTTDAPTFAGVTSTGVLSLPVGSTTSTAIRFGTQGATTGLFSSNGATSPGIGLAISGTAYIYSGDSSRGLCLHSGWPLSWGSNQADSTPGLFLYRDGADGILAQRNGDNAQSFRVYDSYNTAGANFCRANLSFNSNRFELSISSLGTGSTTRGFDIGTNGTGSITFFTGGSNRWQISGTTGQLLSMSDNAFDIGASGANRPRNVYVGTNIFAGANITCAVSATVGAGGYLFHGSNSAIGSNAIGRHTLFDGGGSFYDRLHLGGNTNLFPAIKRVGTDLQIVLASSTAATGVAAVDADMTFIEDRYRRKGAGSPETAVTAPIGAVYHRTDGGAATSFYVKESGTGNTGWVAK